MAIITLDNAPTTEGHGFYFKVQTTILVKCTCDILNCGEIQMNNNKIFVYNAEFSTQVE